MVPDITIHKFYADKIGNVPVDYYDLTLHYDSIDGINMNEDRYTAWVTYPSGVEEEDFLQIATLDKELSKTTFQWYDCNGRARDVPGYYLNKIELMKKLLHRYATTMCKCFEKMMG